MKLLRALLLLCLCASGVFFSGAPSAFAAAPLALDTLRQGVPLSETGHLLWLADAADAMAIDAVRAPHNAARFVAAPHPLRAAHRQQPYWLKVQLQQPAGSGDWVLATHTTSLHQVDFYGPFDATGRALAAPVHTGLSQPYSSRPLGSERYLARLQLPGPGTYTVYVHMVGGTTADLDLSVWDTVQYLQWRQHKRLFDGICYGILLAMLAYNLALAGIFRDRTYGMYIGHCAFALLTLASYNGHAASYLWGGWPWWLERANVVLAGLWMVFAVLFARSFLETGRYSPRFDALLRALALLAALAALLGLAGAFATAQFLEEAVSAAGTLVVLGASITVLQRGAASARWYLAGQSALLLALLGMVLENWGAIDAPFLQANGLQIGIAAEMVVFAIALSSRIGRMRSSQAELHLRAMRLAQAATTDPLTGLANRAGLLQGADHSLASTDTQALLLLDLDRFKQVNDMHGHGAGDALLCAVARRLQAHIRDGDIAARLGGDEFVLLLEGQLTDERLDVLALRLADAVRQPVEFQGLALSVGVSIGIARRPHNAATLNGLLRCADQAMYQAKQAGGGHRFCAESLQSD